MSEQDSTIDLDSSSVLSSTKNDSQLETTNNTIVLSSDTETDDTEDDTDDDEEEEGVEIASVSEVVDSSSSGMRELGGSTTSEATTPGTPFMPDMPSMPDSQAYVLNSAAEQSSVISVSQLSCDDTTMASSAGATLGDSSITILTEQLASHPARLAEVVVEGMGERGQEEEEEEPLRERKRESSVGEIIEDTFRDKSIAASFGEKKNASQKEEPEEPVEVEPSPSKRKSKEGEGGGEEEGQEVPVVGEVAVGGLPAKRQKVADPDLPSTCTLLISPNTGAKVYLIGTAHFSKESCEDVATVIQAVQPDVVMVELCKSRTNILHLDEATILEEAQNLDMEKSLEILKSHGTVQGVMYLLLLSMSAHLTKELGMAPGGEFRRAFIEAMKVPGCKVHLGDRPINITLKRALAALGPLQKLRLGWNILTSKDSITREEVEKCKDRDLLENMLAEMAGEFPALSRVFVAERDLFLAHSLQLAAEGPGAGGGNVVAVVGIGHVPGMVEHWGKVTTEQVKEVVKLEPPSLLGRVIRLTVKTAFWGGCLYGAYRITRGPVSRLLLVR